VENAINIVRSIKSNGNYNTELYSLLNNIQDIKIYNDEHGLRHPLGIYNIAFGKILNSCRKVLDTIKDNEYDKVKYIAFLESINEFIDDGYNIIKCFYPLNITKSKAIFSDKWLESIDQIGISKYKKIINQYTKQVKYIVNKLKHEHGRITEIKIETKYGGCRGYFLEKYNVGSLEPDEYIHKKYKNKGTGYSYILDIMKNISIVYFICEQISRYLKSVLELSKIRNNIIKDETDNNIELLISDIWNSSNVLFPNEYNEDLFGIRIVIDVLEIRYPAPKYFFNKMLYYDSYKGCIMSSGDGTSSTFAIPYF